MRSKIWNEIERSNSFLLLTHENPDGDAIGSVLGFYNFLVSINKSVDMVVLDIPKVFNFLPSIDKVVDTTNNFYDVAIVLDCATKKRIGQKDDLLSRCNTIICIDHHISNEKYGDYNLINGDISSCSQVVYYLLKEWNVKFNNSICESLMCGVLTDTNGFGNNDVDADTYRLATDMMDFGIDIHKIYNKVLQKKTMSQYNLMKIAMDRLEFLCNNKIAFTYILKDDFETVGASKGEHEGIVDIGRNIEGVEVSVFIREDNGYFSVSLRSTGSVDVNKIASLFGGAGHFMAAGSKLTGTVDSIKETIIKEIKKVVL